MHRIRVRRIRALAIAGVGVACITVIAAPAIASARTTITARLTSKSFTVAQAAQVKLNYRLSPASKRFAYRITMKSGSAWQTVKTGTLKGAKSITVKRLFAPRTVKVGTYRLRISAARANRVLPFTVITAASSPTPGGAVSPTAGSWASTGVSGLYGSTPVKITGVSFTVGAGGASVSGFTYQFDYSGVGIGCSGSSSGWLSASSPIASGQFTAPSPTGAWGKAGPVAISGAYQGTFDSATTVHGTSTFTYFLSGSPCTMMQNGSGGPFSWTAVWQDS